MISVGDNVDVSRTASMYDDQWSQLLSQWSQWSELQSQWSQWESQQSHLLMRAVCVRSVSTCSASGTSICLICAVFPSLLILRA